MTDRLYVRKTWFRRCLFRSGVALAIFAVAAGVAVIWVDWSTWVYCLIPAILAYIGVALGACGWTFTASLIGYRTRQITLADEFGEEITYRGWSAILWCVAGMALAVFMFGLAMTLPAGALLDWLDVV